MFRKLLLAGVASLGLLSPFAIPTSADAHEFCPVYRREHACRVYYHDPCRPVWIYAGMFHNRRAAARFAEHYRCRGIAVAIR